MPNYYVVIKNGAIIDFTDNLRAASVTLKQEEGQYMETVQSLYGLHKLMAETRMKDVQNSSETIAGVLDIDGLELEKDFENFWQRVTDGIGRLTEKSKQIDVDAVLDDLKNKAAKCKDQLVDNLDKLRKDLRKEVEKHRANREKQEQAQNEEQN